ncbi:MAG TPA: hypothetical protein DDE71_09965 [Tenacibaculum sp.]|nr:hypothetical protein [Tenacibaculum sp.]
MISDVINSAEEVGITAIELNSEEQLDVQLNNLTRDSDAPVMLISWDYSTTITFNNYGLLNNPITDFNCLLMGKAKQNIAEQKRDVAEEMGLLFQLFLQNLRHRLLSYRSGQVEPLTNAGWINLPSYGRGLHSGVQGRWSMISRAANCDDIYPKQKGVGYDEIGSSSIK